MNAQYDRIVQEIPTLRRRAVMMTRNRDQADDLVQECLMRAVRAAGNLDELTHPRAWLSTILRNVYIDGVRRRKQSPVTSAGDDLADYDRGSPGNQEISLQAQEVARVFGELTPDHRQALMLVGVENLSYEETADRLGISIGTVRSRVARARIQLKRRLEPDAAPGAVGFACH